MNIDIAIPPRPKDPHPVRVLVDRADIDVSHWDRRKDGELLKNPNDNIFQNTQWSFGGDGEPSAVFLWYDDTDWGANPPYHTGNTKEMQDAWNDLARSATDGVVKRRLRRKIDQARKLQDVLYRARSKRLPVRVVFVVGTQAGLNEAGEETSKVTARDLDPAPWYVHEFDPYTGKYRLVRNQPPPPPVAIDPYAHVDDPGLDPAFQEAIADLPETEREALIRARVGQGAFRDALIARWGGCSVTGFSKVDLLIASHIRPWSKCTTPAERLGAANGLLLTPNLDKLFDRGLITFSDQFRIVLSPHISRGHAIELNLNADMLLKGKADKDMLPFLKYHRENIFKQ